MNNAIADSSTGLQPGSLEVCKLECYHNHTNIMARWWSSISGKERRGVGSATESRVYTPNNRCRPEAPLTSLPKLTPAKNVEEDRRVGEGGERKNNTR